MNLIVEKFSEFIDNKTKFKIWFGDSKVVDDDGNPLIVYHGTNYKFDSFDKNMLANNTGNNGHYGAGIYFSKYKKEAETYGQNIYEVYLKIETPFTGTDEEYVQLIEKGWKITPPENLAIEIESLKNNLNDDIFKKFINDYQKYDSQKAWDNALKMKLDNSIYEKLNDLGDILEYTTLSDDVDHIPNFIYSQLEEVFGIDKNELTYKNGFHYKEPLHYVTNLGNYGTSLTETLIELGYDGVIYGSEFVVFDEKQIKSINNDGNWGLDTKNIYK